MMMHVEKDALLTRFLFKKYYLPISYACGEGCFTLVMHVDIMDLDYYFLNVCTLRE